MRGFILYLILVLIPFFGSAQDKLTFNATEFDFGVVGNTDIPFEHDFIFRNTLFSPATILSVRSISPHLKFIHTKSDVFTGEYGFVKVKLYANEASGLVNDEIYVTIRIGEEVQTQILYVRANVSANGTKDNQRKFIDTEIATSVEVSPEDIETMEGFFGKDRLTQVESELKHLKKQVDLKTELIAQLNADLQQRKAADEANLLKLEELQKTLSATTQVNQEMALEQLNSLTNQLQEIQKADEAMRFAISEQEALYEKAKYEADSARAYAQTLSEKLQKQFDAEAKAIEKATKLEQSLALKELSEEQQKRQIDSLEQLIASNNNDRTLQNEIEKLKIELSWKQNEQQLQSEHARKQQARIDELKFQKEQAELLKDSLSQNLNHQTEENLALQSKLSSTATRITEYESKLDSLHRLAEAGNKSKVQSQAQLDSLKHQLESLHTADLELKTTIAQQESEMAKLNAEKSSAEKNLNALEVATARQLEEAHNLMYRINTLSQRESKARMEVQSLQSALSESRQREDSARTEVSVLMEKITTKDQDLIALKTQLNNHESEMKSLRNEEEQLRINLAKAESQNKLTQQQIDSLQALASNADLKKDLLEKDIQRLQNQILNSHNQVEESNKLAAELEGKLQTATMSNKIVFEELKDEVEQISSERDQFKTSYTQAQLEIESLKKQLAESKRNEENAVAFAKEFGYGKTQSSNGIDYAVVIMTSSEELPITSEVYEFRNITVEQKNGRFVYSVVNLSNVKSAEELKEKAKAKGFPLARVIAFKNGVQISLKEAAETAMN